MREKRPGNYLDYVPQIHPRIAWSQEDGRVTVHVTHRGVWAAAAGALAHTPRVSHIRLDACGSFLWLRMDGVRTVGDLALELEAQFGEDVQPLYDRLVHYMRILYNNQFILYRRQEKRG